jgi:hypothetical protein
MKNKRVKSKNKSKQKKIWGALALVMLILTGGAFATPITSDNDNDNSVNNSLNTDDSLVVSNSFHGDLNTIQKNSVDFINLEKINLPNDFNYIDELNREFSEGFLDERRLLDEKALEKAIEIGDYNLWREVLNDLDEFPNGAGVIPKDEFEILVQIRNLKKLDESVEE